MFGSSKGYSWSGVKKVKKSYLGFSIYNFISKDISMPEALMDNDLPRLYEAFTFLVKL